MDKKLAYETLSQILNYLKDDQQSLLQLSRTCNKLHKLCAPFLFRSPQFKTFQRFESFATTLSVENGAHVREIDLHMVPHRWELKTNDLLYTISEKTPDLELLNLELCYKLTNKALKRITKPLHDLRILSVDQCETIGDHSIEQVVVNCPYLQKLYLGSTHITDNSLNAIANNLILLTHLHVRGCEYITEIGVNHVVRKCKTLQDIDIKDCYNVLGSFGPNILHLLTGESDRTPVPLNMISAEMDTSNVDQWEDTDDEEDLLDGDRPPEYSLF